MSGPVTGIGRITIPYTVTALTHECRMYVWNPTLAGSQWNIDIRPDVGGVADWTLAAQGLADAISFLLATGVTAGTASLEELSGTGWLPRDTTTVTLTNLAGSSSLATQATLTLRDENFTRPKIVVMEINQAGPFKLTSPAAGGANFDGFIDAFLGTSSVAQRPWFFMVNQHGHFLLDNSFVSTTVTYNRKLRRARGLA